MRGPIRLEAYAVSHSDPEPAPTTAAPGAPLVALLLASVGFGLIAMTICLPSLQQWSTVFEASQADVQLTFSVFILGLAGAQLLYGPLSDRHGRRRFLLVGFGLAVLGSLAAALAPDLPGLLVARFVQGTGVAAGMVIGRAMVQDYFSGADRPRVMAYIGMAMGTCPPLATIIGGQIHVGLGWRANFWLTAGGALALFVTTWLVVPADKPSVDPAAGTGRHWFREMISAYRQLLRLPAFLAYAAILGMCTGTFYIFLAGAPTVLASYGVGPDTVGFYIMFIPLSYIAGNFVTSRLVKRFSERQLMMMGQVSAVAGIALVLLLSVVGVKSPLALTVPLVFLGLGHGLLMPSVLSGTVALVPALAGAAVGVAGLAQHLLGAFGGYAVGLVEHHDVVNLALMMLAFMLFSLWCQLLLGRVESRDLAGLT